MDFIDLKKQYQRIKPSVQKRINTILDCSGYIMGKEITELEEKLASYVGTKYCLTCSSGTDALLLPLLAKGIGPGDAVFTSTFTFFATAEVIALCGATPVFVDIQKDTYNIDPEKLHEEIQKVKNQGLLKPKAIIPVDIFGLCADYDTINIIAQEFDLYMIEDAAQSFGATYKSKKAGSFGDIAATSFFPAKPLGCYGDGGAVFFNDPEMVELIKSLRVHGQGTDKYENVRIGINGRMDTIQAAILLAKLEIFEDELLKRTAIAKKYSTALNNKFITPYMPKNDICAWAQYSLQCENRDSVLERLKKEQIPSAIYYPKPLHLQKAFDYLHCKAGNYPVAEQIAQKIFSLPMHPYLEEKEQEKIISVLMNL